MAVKIPQNVDKEDKLVGPLTLKQFLYILGGSALMFATWQYHVEGYLFFTEFILISLVISVLMLALAFVKINGRPFIVLISNTLAYIFTHKQRFWSRHNHMSVKKLKIAGDNSFATEPRTSKDEATHGKLEKLAHILDTGGKINTDDKVDDHEINTFNQKNVDNQTIKDDLKIEDILAQTKI